MLGSVTGVGLRGSPPSATTYPEGMGEGCLFDTGLSYGRVQWQTEHCASVPDDAQGIGLVIVRDFGRHLADDFDVRVIGGASQSAWFVNTLIAEGFNVDPARRHRCVHRRALLPLRRQLAGIQPPRRRRHAAVSLRAACTLAAHGGRDAVASGVRPVLRRHHQLHGVLPAAGERVRVGTAPRSGPSLRRSLPRTDREAPSSHRSSSPRWAATAVWRSRSTRSSRVRTRVACSSASLPTRTRSRRRAGSSSGPRPSRRSTSTRCRARRCRSHSSMLTRSRSGECASPTSSCRSGAPSRSRSRLVVRRRSPMAAATSAAGSRSLPMSSRTVTEPSTTTRERYAAILDSFVADGFVLPRDRDGVIKTARRQFTSAT